MSLLITVESSNLIGFNEEFDLKSRSDAGIMSRKLSKTKTTGSSWDELTEKHALKKVERFKHCLSFCGGHCRSSTKLV